ncbi:hypothetical protein E2L06_19475 [Haloterrigena sp. H1]|nr:hypothetical protein E2L06_21240 [Haloterrigena sp. H1]TMT78489.1 hypothetical protein E2L06_20470 [Haloterrigena sp. H1]TMT80412.1 hypothetical protein E2L06_19475 [Haloterrigena sp. H1]
MKIGRGFAAVSTGDGRSRATDFVLTSVRQYEKSAIVATETIYTPIAQSSCDRVCSNVQWLR